MNRQLPGIMAIALIAGSVITLLTLPTRDPILIAGVEYPKTIERTNDRFAFTLTMIATRDVQNLSVEIGTLPIFSPTYLGLNVTPREGLGEYLPLDMLGTALEHHGIDLAADPRKEVVFGEPDLELLYYDVAPYIFRVAGGRTNPNLPYVTSRFAFVYRRDDLEYSFKGGPEIFPGELSTISEIRFEVNGMLREEWRVGDERKYFMGRLSFGNITRKDRIDLIYYLDGRRVWRWKLINLLEVSADGIPIHYQAYLINP